MSVVSSSVSPLNCRWIVWEENLPLCTRPAGNPRPVTEAECAVCELWDDGAEAPPTHAGKARVQPGSVLDEDPMDRQACPECGSHDVVLIQHDELVQSFACSICHQKWLASRPWRYHQAVDRR